jgi:HEAT repeat protein
MSIRRARWLIIVALLVLVGVVVGIVYLPDVVSARGEYYEGRPARYWVRALESPDVELRRHATRAVSSFGPDGGADAVPVLARMLTEDPDPEARVLASLALTKLAPTSRAAVPELARALGDDDPLVRMNAANALFMLGPDARPAVPALTNALGDDRNDLLVHTLTLTIRERVILTLGRAGTPDTAPALREVLKTAKTPGTRRAVAQALGDLGPDARPAVPDLKELLKDENDEVREAAEQAIRKIGG